MSHKRIVLRLGDLLGDRLDAGDVVVSGGRLTTAVAAELAVRLGVSPSLRVGEQWVGATSTVVRWGDSLTVKIPHRDREAIRVCLLHAQVSSAARLLGVRTPEVLAIVEDLDRLVTVPLIVSRFLPGHRLSPGDSTVDVWAAVGSQLSILHTAPAARMPPGLRSFTQTEDVDLGVLAERLHVAERLDVAIAGRLMRLGDELRESVVPDDQPVLCHGDVHAGNVIASAGRYVGVVDFAGAGWLDAAWDFVGVPVAAVPWMLEGYRALDGRQNSLLERITWCRLQTAVHRLALSADPNAAASRALMEAGLLLS